jgi:hypothetical protein
LSNPTLTSPYSQALHLRPRRRFGITNDKIVAYFQATEIGLGFVHFLHDRWAYRFSNSEVRATIGTAFA